MKRTLILIAAATLVSASALAQGYVTFSIIGAPITNSLTMMPVAAGTAFRAALYLIPDQLEAPTLADFDRRSVILPPFSGAFLPGGFFNAGRRTAPDGNPSGVFPWFQVRAWETAFGSSYEAARDNRQPQGGRLALIGTSNIFRVGPLGGTLIATPGLIYNNGLKGFILVPVPEPSVIGLGILGVGVLLLLRNHK
jgi:hypothetical protein